MGKTCCTIIALFITVTSAKAQLVFPNVYVQYDSVWAYKNLQLIPIRFIGTAAAENKKTSPKILLPSNKPCNRIKLPLKK